MKNETKQEIVSLVTTMIERKLANKKGIETESRPFFEALFSKSVIIQGSLLQSFYTSFGMSLYEQIAVILAHEAGYHVERQKKLEGTIDQATSALIEKIMLNEPQKQLHVEELRKSVQPSELDSIHPDRVVDVYIVRPDGVEMLFEIKTVKPNLSEFRAARRKLLNWCALRFSQKSNATVETYIGIPYNPYSPQPYTRWTGKELDPDEVLIQEELWSKFAGYDVFAELIDTFKVSGDQMRDRIEQYIRTH